MASSRGRLRRERLDDHGDEVIGGTVNGDGSLRVYIEATGEEMTLIGIMRLVKEAQKSEVDYVGGPNLLTQLESEVPPALRLRSS